MSKYLPVVVRWHFSRTPWSYRKGSEGGQVKIPQSSLFLPGGAIFLKKCILHFWTPLSSFQISENYENIHHKIMKKNYNSGHYGILLGQCPVNQKVIDSIPGHDMPTWWVWSQSGHMQEASNCYFCLTSMFLSLSFSPLPFSLKSIRMSLGGDTIFFPLSPILLWSNKFSELFTLHFYLVITIGLHWSFLSYLVNFIPRSLFFA